MSNATRDWLAFDYQSWQLVTSPSACESATDCMRQWWFKKVVRLKVPDKHFTQLGDVFHEVAERWLEADDNGRGADGNQVDVFPEGWAERLSHGQEAVVRALFRAMVDKALESFGALHILINNAGILRPTQVIDI
ncbi:MAG: PD-(D/E)XK nuclease family protein, partial [Planctomycetes bacterium]|nr:PD-(D/E)XK nuclease family protein [Planctomycetota bacterium]